MRIRKIKKQINRINNRIEHYNKVLNDLGAGKDRDNCLLIIAKLSLKKIELEKELEREIQERKTRFLHGVACTFGTVALVCVVLAIFLVGSDKEAEIQRNKVANHRIEQAYIVK